MGWGEASLKSHGHGRLRSMGRANGMGCAKSMGRADFGMGQTDTLIIYVKFLSIFKDIRLNVN